MHGDGIEWMDEGLPTPTYLEHINRGYIIAWAIDGFFWTEKGQKYLNDIIARVLITFAPFRPQRLNFKPNITSAGHYYPKIYKLKELQALRSLAYKQKAPLRADNYSDYTFWAIKLFCEDLIRKQGIVGYEQLEEFALANFLAKKDRSTLKAKCRSVWHWYNDRDWKLDGYKRKMTNEEYEMTRRERSEANAKLKFERSKKAIINTITGLYADEYKKKNGSWHIGKIAKAVSMTEKTVAKHLKEYEREKTQG